MPEPNSKALSVDVQLRKDEPIEEGIARSMLNPLVLAAATVGDYVPTTGVPDLNCLVKAMEHQVNAIKEGNLERVEEMLIAQAHTLDAVANQLFRRSIIQEQTQYTETYLRLGLKAQNQCRATLEAVIRAKNPKTQLSQTNIAHGYQQVNNFPEKEKPPNELLEKTDGERLDTRTTPEAVKGDRALETVGKKHRAKNV